MLLLRQHHYRKYNIFQDLLELCLHSDNVCEELLRALDDTGRSQGVDFHPLLDGRLGQMFADLSKQTQVSLPIFFRGQTFDVEEAEDVDDETSHVSVKWDKFEDRSGHLVPFDGPANAFPEEIVDQELQVLILLVAEIEQAGVGDGWEVGADRFEAKNRELRMLVIFVDLLFANNVATIWNVVS